jgi:hypothetical protein
MGYGIWDMGDEMMGDGRWAVTISWIIQPRGRISYIQSSISDAFDEGPKKRGAFRVFIYL